MRYATLVMGPAGSGKSTFCNTLVDYMQTHQRSVHVLNLDPGSRD